MVFDGFQENDFPLAYFFDSQSATVGKELGHAFKMSEETQRGLK